MMLIRVALRLERMNTFLILLNRELSYSVTFLTKAVNLYLRETAYLPEVRSR